MGDVAQSILGAEFRNLCFIGGLMFIVIGIFCRKPVRIGPVNLPSIDLVGRILACLIGLVLISVTAVSWSVGSRIGLFRVSAQSASTSSREQNRSGLIEKALAQDNEKVLQNIEIEQRHVKKLNVANGELYLYIGDVHLKSPSHLLIYRAKEEYISLFKEGNRIEYDNILARLKREDIVLQAKVKEGVEILFGYQGKEFKLRVTKVIWYLFASDFMEIQIVETGL